MEWDKGEWMWIVDCGLWIVDCGLNKTNMKLSNAILASMLIAGAAAQAQKCYLESFPVDSNKVIEADETLKPTTIIDINSVTIETTYGPAGEIITKTIASPAIEKRICHACGRG